jgi:IS605 OrfB family transposase
MKLSAKVKLAPDEQQRRMLLATLERANEACNRVSELAWEHATFRQYPLHKLAYAAVRQETGLTAQMVVRAIARVADAYKLDRHTQRTFRPHGAFPYDERILRWYTDRQAVSIWTLTGRVCIPYLAGERQKEYLSFRRGESDLVFDRGEFYLFATCDVPDPEEKKTDGVLGVDLGIVNLAVDSDGTAYSGDRVERSRRRYERLRARLQRRGTKSSRRKLKRISGRQARFQTDTNHGIAKRIVATAERTNRSIALEDLKGIRARTRVRGRDQRARHGNWAFYQLREFVAYKGRMRGIPLIYVDPHFTSQRCSACGHTEKANRKSQAEFVCVLCGHTDLADHNAARNIAWAAVNPPIVSDAEAPPSAAPGTSCSL